jgi:site-specific recombinase XerD
MNLYIVETKHHTLQYYRRVPKKLLKYVGTSKVRIGLSTEKEKATVTALQYNKVIEEALYLIKIGADDGLILSCIKILRPKEKEERALNSELFSSTVERYINSKVGQIADKEIKEKINFYGDVCSSIFKKILGTSDPKLSDITYSDLLKFKEIIGRLPKRNIEKYKRMDMFSLLKILDEIPTEERVSARTINRAIKWIRAIFNFSIVLGELEGVNLAHSVPLVKTEDDRLQRLPLDDDEYDTLLKKLTKEKRYLVQILKYTGMRLSELYKCKIDTVDDVLVFSLLDKGHKLKTNSSYRVIPIHTSLLEELHHFYTYRNRVSNHRLSQSVSMLIKKLNFDDSKKKSLYSLRHSFATKLIQIGADSNLVSELLGHSHGRNMTLSRYASGFNVSQLQAVIQLL